MNKILTQKIRLLLLAFASVVTVLAVYIITLPDGASEEDLSRKALILPDRKTLSVEPFVLGLRNPWGMVFLPSGEMLVTESSGEIRVIKDGVLLEEKVQGVPPVYEHGQGGLLDIELHPDFKNNHYLYLTYASQEGDGDGGNTALMRARLDGYSLVEQKVLYKAVPNTTAGEHFGSRITFDKQGFLYFSIGERGDRDNNPQNISRDGGKIYRLHDDGQIPSDNPFVNIPNAKKAIFTYGNRNPQGLAFHPTTGDLWEHEHGPRGGDEINIIRAGRNYGWPVISYGINYDGTEFAEGIVREGMEQPLSYWVPSIAPCGMTFIVGDKYPGWEGDLIVGSLKFNHLVRVDVEGDKVIEQEMIAQDIGRVRNVEQGPDGYLYVGVQDKGIFRLKPIA